MQRSHYPIDLLISLSARLCTMDAVQGLLREYKPLFKDAVKITAENKESLLGENLRRAVEANAVPHERIVDLIRDAEENGNQHIFFYHVPRRLHSRLSDPDSFGNALIGARWKEAVPRLCELPDGPYWSDVRGPRPYDLTTLACAKHYERHERLEYIGQREDDGELIKRYKRILSRGVLFVRYRKPHLLELRVPDYGSRRAILDARARLLNLCSDVFKEADLTKVNFGKAITQLARNQGANTNVYTVGDSCFMDKDSGSANFSSATGEEGLFANQDRQRAIAVYLKRADSCRDLAITWKATTASDSVVSEFRTEVGLYDANHVAIGASITQKAIDYATNRLI